MPALTFESPLLPGLRYQDEFVSVSEEASLLSGISTHPHQWKHLHNRTLQNWGGLPHIKGMLPTPLPRFLHPLLARLHDSAPFEQEHPPNHVLVNRYLPGQGIAPHEDGPVYRPRAAIISLQAPLVMHFFRVPPGANGIPSETAPTARLLLRPRSLLLIAGDVYTTFYHAIAECAEDVLDETVLNATREEHGVLRRRERTSLTVRASCKTLRNPLQARLKR